MDVLDEITFTEGDEEVQYVIVDLPGQVVTLLPPGTNVSIEGLDTDQPKLLLPDGTRFKGNYEDNLGTILVFASKAAAVCDQHPEDMEVDGRASAASEATESGTAAARSAHQQASDDLQYLCHTEKVLAFTEVKDGGRRG